MIRKEGINQASAALIEGIKYARRKSTLLRIAEIMIDASFTKVRSKPLISYSLQPKRSKVFEIIADCKRA
jgi:hypothetical protein